MGSGQQGVDAAVYLFGAQADADPAKVNLSGLTNDQDFSSPDGLWFSRATGLCWIQTDDGAYTGPGGATARPRSAAVVITKDDGGRIGS